MTTNYHPPCPLSAKGADIGSLRSLPLPVFSSLRPCGETQ